MDIQLTRHKRVIIIYVVLVALITCCLLIMTWWSFERPDLIIRPSRHMVLNYLAVALIPAGILKIIWDSYLVYYKVPLVKISDDSISIKRLFTKYYAIPLSKIESIKIKGNIYSSNIRIKIRKTPFKNITKYVFEVHFTKEAEAYLLSKNVEVLRETKPLLYLRKNTNG